MNISALHSRSTSWTVLGIDDLSVLGPKVSSVPYSSMAHTISGCSRGWMDAYQVLDKPPKPTNAWWFYVRRGRAELRPPPFPNAHQNTKWKSRSPITGRLGRSINLDFAVKEENWGVLIKLEGVFPRLANRFDHPTASIRNFCRGIQYAEQKKWNA